MASSTVAHSETATPSDTPLSLVAKHATLPAALHLRSLTLIGIVGPTATPSALLRQKDGRILKLDVGDSSPVGTLAAIDHNSVRLSRNGRIKTLSLPQG